MRVSVTRKNIRFTPDSSRVVARYFMNGDQRTQKMVSRIMTLNENKSYTLWNIPCVSLPADIGIFREYFLSIAKISRGLLKVCRLIIRN
jgi:hypothetical protein